MKKGTLILITLLLMVIGYSAYNTTINLYGNSKIAENISDFKVYISSLKVNGNEVSGINETKDGFELSNVFGTIEYEITNDSTEYDTEASLECSTNNTWDFDYTGSEQIFVVPATGTYKLETWGAQGGSYNSFRPGGYGGYSTGNIKLNSQDVLYINVGGAGSGNGFHTSQVGGYNGGGDAVMDTDSHSRQSSGGGATHISYLSGTLKKINRHQPMLSKILIVSGGGGGSAANEVIMSTLGGSGGGYIGNNGEKYNESSTINGIGKGGTQTNSPVPEYGSGIATNYYSIGGMGYGASGVYAGGGSGLYGGSVSVSSSGGGSGYIGNSLLTDKSMYCYNCSESSEESTKTISTTCTSSTPTSACAKQGNGHARITFSKDIVNFVYDNGVVNSNSKTSQVKNSNYNYLSCKLKTKKLSKTIQNEYFLYDYTGGEQTFKTPISGTYKLETWGAQGGSYDNYKKGGYGGYAMGFIKLNSQETLYINVGGAGSGAGIHISQIGGYNGGGNATIDTDFNTRQSSGGGATHIATTSGKLSSLINSIDKILIVSGGGGGSAANEAIMPTLGGDGGGYIGNDGEKYNQSATINGIGKGGTQNNSPMPEYGTGLEKQYYSMGGMGYGANGVYVGGGGGFYGGSVSVSSSGGGSGYIGNTLLTNKAMYCYNCSESNEESTKTISTTCINSTPTSACSKQGNGYARITLISID